MSFVLWSYPICVMIHISTRMQNWFSTTQRRNNLNTANVTRLSRKNSSLINHSRIHTVEIPFQCNQCVKAFSRNSIFTNHMRIHTGERPYQCSHCDKAFSHNNDFKTMHMRNHSRERPYQCSDCDKAFTQNSILVYHLKSHWGETIPL